MKIKLGPFKSSPAGYVSAIGIAVAALLIYQTLVKFAGGPLPTYITFYPAVIITVLFAGIGAGILASVTSIVLTAYWILPPEGFAVSSLPDAVGMAIFLVNCILINVVVALYHRERQRTADYAAELALRDERKKAEEALRQSEEQYRLLFEAANDGVVLHPFSSDRERCRFIRFNRVACQMLGYSAEEMAQLSPFDIEAPGDQHQKAAEVQQMVRDCRLLFEKTLIGKDGRRFPAEINSTIFELQGQTMVMSIIRDITARKQAEHAIHESEQRLKFHFENSPLAVVEWNADFIVTQWSSEAERIFGWKKDEVLGKRIDALNMIYPEDVPIVNRTMERLNSGSERTVISSNRNYTKSGGVIECVWYNSVLLDKSGRMTSVMSLVQDITERRRAETALQERTAELEERTRQLEASNKEHESFTYTVSHDLRAPLRAIDGFSRILLKECEAMLDEEGKRALNIIRKNTQNMGQLIDDLLAFSRLGRQQITVQEIDMANLAESVYEEIKAAAPGRTIAFAMQRLPKAQGDKILIRQAIANLLSNAVKFTQHRTEANIEFGAQVEEHENVYYVKDNGVGFDMQYVGKLFGIFQRLHSVDEFEGTGVGLAIVKRAIVKHGGRVWAEGKVSEGATIYFSLPKTRATGDG